MHHSSFNGQGEPCKSCPYNRGFAGCELRKCILDKPRDDMASLGFEAQKIREAIRQFSLRMAEKMKSKIGQRSGWDDRKFFPLSHRLGRLAEECNELLEAIKSGDADGTQKEAVDVANIAMMVWSYFEADDLPDGWSDFAKNI